MMVLALISTACISNVIYSLQAMLIYVRISNARKLRSEICYALLTAHETMPLLDSLQSGDFRGPKC